MKNYTFNETDTQFLDALLLATGGEGSAPLQEVLLMADAADGTVFELKEVEAALLKLLAINIVIISKNKIGLNAAFLQQYEAYTLEQGMHENSDLLLNLLQQQTLTDGTIKVAKEKLKKYKLRNYYQAYQEQFGG